MTKGGEILKWMQRHQETVTKSRRETERGRKTENKCGKDAGKKVEEVNGGRELQKATLQDNYLPIPPTTLTPTPRPMIHTGTPMCTLLPTATIPFLLATLLPHKDTVLKGEGKGALLIEMNLLADTTFTLLGVTT